MNRNMRFNRLTDPHVPHGPSVNQGVAIVASLSLSLSLSPLSLSAPAPVNHGVAIGASLYL